MKHLISYLSVVALIVSIGTGCSTSPKTTTFKTIAAMQSAVEIGLAEYQRWAVKQEIEHPEKSASLLRLDGRVKNALDVYKSGAISALQGLKLDDVPPATVANLATEFLSVAATRLLTN